MTSPRLIYRVVLVLMLGLATFAIGQGVDFENRPVGNIKIEGVNADAKQLVLNQIRTKTGDPYSGKGVAQDIQNITRLGQFSSVQVRAEPQNDGSVDLVYAVTQLKLLADVQVIGNEAVSDGDLLEAVQVSANDPIDKFLIDQGVERVKKAYRAAGYFLAGVTVDDKTLNESNVLIYRVREGPRVKVQEIEFRGNSALTEDVLDSEIKTKTYIPVFRKGELSEDQLDKDVAKVREMYEQRGYLDVRVGRQIQLSDDQRDAKVVFFVEEGKLFTVGEITINGNKVMSKDQLREAMPLKVGDIYSVDRLRKAQLALDDLYGKVGYVEAKITINRVFHEDSSKIDMKVDIIEGARYTVGNVIVRGNALTQDKVIRREIRGIEPGRAFDETGIEHSELRIRETGLFREAKMTIQGDPTEVERDVLVEVKEGQTGSISLGAAVSSDAGLLGAFNLTQRNFDVMDPPESFDEMVTGRAFRGAGQTFSLNLQPGSEFQRYEVRLLEPRLMESNYSLDNRAMFFRRQRTTYDEERAGGSVGLGRRFGDVWSASVRFRAEEIKVLDLDSDAPFEVQDVEGSNALDSIGFNVSRSTVDSRLFPTTGSRLTFGVERYGAFGTEFEFTRGTVSMDKFWTIDEDLFGRKTVLKFRFDTGYIFENGEAPLFERFYAGGHRTFRGFRFRGAGPRGQYLKNVNGSSTLATSRHAVGGDFLFLAGLEYNYPIWEEIVRGVFFIDTGTVQDEIALDEYRVAVGAGIRLKVPFLGQAPFAFDVAIPVVKEEGDRTRLFSFDLALPF